MTRAERRRAKRNQEKHAKHLKRLSSGYVYRCPFCGAWFKELEDLFAHQDRLGHVVPI